MSATGGRRGASTRGSLTRRALLLGGGGLALGGCTPPEVTRVIGHQVVYTKAGRRLVVVEGAEQRIHVRLMNTADEDFIMYTSEVSAGDWMVLPEDGRVVLVHGPRAAIYRERSQNLGNICSSHAIDREHHIRKGETWSSTVSLADFHKANDPRDISPYYERLARSRVLTVETILVRVVSPLHSRAGHHTPKFPTPSDLHMQIGAAGWAEESVGGEFKLARPKRILVDMAPRLDERRGYGFVSP